MNVRDRKAEFLSKATQPRTSKQLSTIEKSKKVSQSKESRSKSDETFGEKVILPFLRKVEQINKRLCAIENAITNVISIQKAILEFTETDEKLEKSFDGRDFPGSPTELRICTSQVLALKKILASCVSYYFSIQEEYKEKCKDRVRRQAQIAGVDLSKVNLDNIMSNKTEIFLKKAIPDYDVSHYYLSEVRKRHEIFLKLEHSLNELRDLFFDLALVVQVDFTQIDRVDKHTLAANRIILEGRKNAVGYRSAMRIKKFKKVCAYGCVATVIVISFAALLIFTI
ncbi:hypothetical protein JTE90_014162 [Oedothorax gibbosus]|uniref:t-SNARE coiled-coil homology domain-containing protein n=1 Tax=Oedothorax gibbosus TaxID=931172 RepID=A0AAV6VKB1_9ARAC|nr:hypothetical protein JTE90_014162 [Oedothorax gibbosus]